MADFLFSFVESFKVSQILAQKTNIKKTLIEIYFWLFVYQFDDGQIDVGHVPRDQSPVLYEHDQDFEKMIQQIPFLYLII